MTEQEDKAVELLCLKKVQTMQSERIEELEASNSFMVDTLRSTLQWRDLSATARGNRMPNVPLLKGGRRKAVQQAIDQAFVKKEVKP